MLDFSHERALIKSGFRLIAGVDEVGRGPLAGPVMAAAVVLNTTALPEGVRDSKKLSPARREVLYNIIQRTAHIGIGEANVAEIDRLNIRNATFLAMERALKALRVQPDFTLIDGRDIPKNWPTPARAVVKGDDTVLSIACASVMAKVTRDRLMQALSHTHPHYGWETNAGYGTKAHQEGLRSHGITPHHRRTFAPVRTLLDGEIPS